MYKRFKITVIIKFTNYLINKTFFWVWFHFFKLHFLYRPTTNIITIERKYNLFPCRASSSIQYLFIKSCLKGWYFHQILYLLPYVYIAFIRTAFWSTWTSLTKKRVSFYKLVHLFSVLINHICVQSTYSCFKLWFFYGTLP